KTVRIEVWGRPLEPTVELRVHSVRVLGVGLHILLRSALTDSARDLKIAQPGTHQLRGSRLTIDNAAYVSFAGKKLSRSGDQPALELSWSAT
ncbi:MAG TPA: hypothetical protein VKA53_09395, partial [Thermoanaerobaculia bacterium]|nr:hypothetical protein [Thermoanaerobaculia bacterium]